MRARRTFLSLAAALLVAGLVFASAASAASAEPSGQSPWPTLRLVGDSAYPPYSFLYDGAAKGIDVEVVQELTSRLGIKLTLELTSRSEMMRRLREGRCDGVLALRPTEDNLRLALLLRRHPLHVSTYSAFVHRARRIPIHQPEDLKGHAVGLEQGTDLGGDFRRMVRSGEVRLTEYASSSMAVGALLRGEVEIYLGQTRAVLSLLDKGGLSGTVLAEGRPLFKRGGEYLGLARASSYPDKARLLRLMELAMTDLMADGTYRRIVRRYVP